ncbi:MAG TPA: sugar ABC transporter substrate-binding protein [Spirochaetia bacterium]|nr:sugar ABC transporter substrate-binding protein [Spirochaetia bacterium]
MKTRAIGIMAAAIFLLSAVTAFSQAKDISFVTGSWWEPQMQQFKDAIGYDQFDKFKEETGIKVAMETFPFEDLFHNLEVRLSSKDPTLDVFAIDSPLTASYAARGYTQPVGNNLSKAEMDKFFPATVQIATYKGQVWNVPFENSSQVMYINKDLFKKAGIALPSSDVKARLTWEQVVDYARKIQALNLPGVWGLLFDQASRPYQMLALPQSLGAGSGVSPDGLKVDGYLNNAGWQKAMQWWYDVNNTWKIHPKGIAPAETAGQFSAGNIGIYIGGTWNIPAFMDAKTAGRLDFDILPHPYFKGGKPATGTNSWHLAVSPYSQKQDAAWKFVKFMTSDKIMADRFVSIGQLVANKVMTDVINKDPKYKEFPWIAYKTIVTYELANTAVPRPATPFWLEMEDQVGKAFEDVRNGADPKQTLDRTVQILERAAQKYR